jgi:DASS family divalent anion:Na+ symporter
MKERIAADALGADPVLGRLRGIQIASLLAHVERRSLGAGQRLYGQGEPADTIFKIVEGAIRIDGPGRQSVVRTDGLTGEEALFGTLHYDAQVVAEQPTEVLAIPASALKDLAGSDPGMLDAFFQSYARRYKPTAPPDETHSGPSAEPSEGIAPLLGWIFVIAAPIAVLSLAPALGLEGAASKFLAIIAITVCMWLFGLVPEYVPPLFAALAVILLDIAPPEQALSGFRSQSFFMCLSVFGLGALLVSSGLTYRFALSVLSRVPASQLGYNASLFGLGALLSPIIPSAVGRVSILSPFTLELIRISQAGRGDLYANRLIYSMTGGAAVLIPLFLTASVPNLLVYGLLDPQTQFAFDWVSWFQAASLYGILVVMGFFAVSLIFFRGARKFVIPREIIVEQRRVLGPISVAEWTAIFAVCTLVAGLLTEALHHVEFPWIALAIFVTLMLFGSLQRDALKTQIDWPVLVYIGAIIGWVPIAQRTGLDRFIIDNLTWMGAYMAEDLPLFIAVVSGVILLVRLAVPTGVTVVLFVTALFPLAMEAGVSLWVIGFVILAVADTFIFPYQSAYFLKIRNDLFANGFGDVCDTRRIALANVTLILVRIAAIYGCLVFWTYLDLI